MKKVVLTIAIVLGMGLASNAQIFNRDGSSMNGNREGDDTPFLPGHGLSDNQNANQTPLGGGALLLIGFGAAYAMTKKREK